MTSNSPSPHNVPPFYGFIETTVQALRLIHAARQGIIPRITHRLNGSERRKMVHSGAVFVFSVEESGIKRWTDGLLWSPSRIVGNFLVYREINRRSGRGGHKKSHAADETSHGVVPQNSREHRSSSFKGLSHSGLPTNDQGTFKPGGLIKKTITVTVDGSDLHLISYYTLEDVRSGRLKGPASRPDIMALPMPPHIFRLTKFRNPPKVDIGADGKLRLISDAADAKMEDPVYRPPDGSDGQSNRNGMTYHIKSYDNLPLAIDSNTVLESSFYSGAAAAQDRWAEPYDMSHSPPKNETRGQVRLISPIQLQRNDFAPERRGENSDHPDSLVHSSSPSSLPTNRHAGPRGLAAATSDLFEESRTPRNSSQYYHPSMISHSLSTDDRSLRQHPSSTPSDIAADKPNLENFVITNSTVNVIGRNQLNYDHPHSVPIPSTSGYYTTAPSSNVYPVYRVLNSPVLLCLLTASGQPVPPPSLPHDNEAQQRDAQSNNPSSSLRDSSSIGD